MNKLDNKPGNVPYVLPPRFVLIIWIVDKRRDLHWDTTFATQSQPWQKQDFYGRDVTLG
jgi:hypothetical protein